MGTRIVIAAVLLGAALSACGGGVGRSNGGGSGGDGFSGTLNVWVASDPDFRNAAADSARSQGVASVFQATVDRGPFVPCPPFPRGLNDIRDGTTVKVENGSGSTLGVGPLTNGLFTFDPTRKTAQLGCVFNFSIGSVPQDEDFYEVSVGGRGSETYSRADLKGRSWKVALNIG